MRLTLNFRNKAAPFLNQVGALAYSPSPAWELYAALATAALGDQGCETASTYLARLREQLARNAARFVASPAI